MNNATVCLRQTIRSLWCTPILGMAIGGAITVAPHGVMAQDASSLLEEVIVSARKTEETSQSVPIAITALSANDLEAGAVLNVQDLAARVTGLVIAPNSQGGAPTFAIRASKQDNGTEGGITTYVDDVPMTSTLAIANSTYDMNSISVLKGPQGTLFGTNATGGAVIFRPNKPTDEFEGYLDAGAGNYGRQEFGGMVNVPVSDMLQLRLAAEVVRRDGFVRNLTPVNGNSELSNDEHESARLSVRLRPSETVTNDLVADYYSQDMQPRQSIYVGNPGGFLGNLYVAPVGPPGSGVFATGGGIRVPSNNHTVSLGGRCGADTNNAGICTPTFNKAELWGVGNTTTFDINNNLSIKNVLGYRHDSTDTFEDNDSISLVLVNGRTQHTNKQWTDELSVNFQTDDNSVRYRGGVYVSDTKKHTLNSYNLGWIPGFTNTPASLALAPFLGNTLPQNTGSTYQRDLKSHAIFSQIAVDLSQELTATLGLRYTWDEGEYGTEEHGGTGTNVVFNPTGAQSVGPCRTLVVAAYGALDGPCHATIKSESSAPSWNFTLEDQFSDESMIYFTTRGGYQAGGFNNQNPAPFQTFEPEKVVDFEAGLKSDWSIAGRPLRTNIDAFYGHYSDMQRVNNYSLVSGPLAGNTPIGVFNAGSSTYYGTDVEVAFFPIDSLEFDVAWTYVKATYDQFRIPAIPGAATPNDVAVDLDGSAIAQTPEHTITAAVHLNWPLPSSVGDVSSTLSYYYRSETRFHDVKPPGFEEFDTSKSFGVADFTTSWKGIFGSPIDAGVWVKNLADKEYAIYRDVQVAFGYETATFGDARTYGASIRYSF